MGCSVKTLASPGPGRPVLGGPLHRCNVRGFVFTFCQGALLVRCPFGQMPFLVRCPFWSDALLARCPLVKCLPGKKCVEKKTPFWGGAFMVWTAKYPAPVDRYWATRFHRCPEYLFWPFQKKCLFGKISCFRKKIPFWADAFLGKCFLGKYSFFF